MRTTDVFNARFGQAEEAHFAFTYEIADGPGDILHRHGSVHPMLVEQIDLTDAEPEKRCVGDLADVFGPAMGSTPAAPRERSQPNFVATMALSRRPLSARPRSSDFFGFFGGLYPAYVRGQRYLALGQGDKAAAEFQKIIDHPGVVYADSVGALSYLDIGRACALSGNKARAKSAYQKFLSLWRDADPDMPVYKKAKAEYSRLQ
jgi:tetratricopeptide (TPR) repeat protein